MAIDNKKSSTDDYINGIIDGAVSSMNFDKLSQDIGESIQSVFNELGVSINISEHIRRQGYGGTASRTASSRVGARKGQQAAVQQEREKPIAVRNPRGSVSGLVLTALGGFFTAVFGIAEFVMLALGMTVSGFALPGWISAVSIMPFLLMSIGSLVVGNRINARIKRFKKYLKQIGKRKFCNISELAESTGKSEQFVADDLQTMIDKDFFTNAHIDSQKTTLMLDEETYQQYLSSMNQYHQKLMQEEEKKRDSGTDDNSELSKALSEGEKYIAQIREANAAIPGEAFTEKLNRMEELTKKIFDIVRQKPDQLYKLRRFMRYYMPTTVKLLNAYTELESHQISSENIQRSKKDIEDTVDTINYAYEKLLDSFFEESAIDISSDISVMESMFAQDGLSKDPFETSSGLYETFDDQAQGAVLTKTDGGDF